MLVLLNAIPAFLVFSMFPPQIQIDAVSFGYRTDDHASFRMIFEAYGYFENDRVVRFGKEHETHYDFHWDFGDGNTGHLPAVMNTYASAGTYDVTLTVTSRTGSPVMFTETASISVEEVFEVPNVFTPDGDGINDTFHVRSDGVTPLTITIYDRGGSIVYRHTSPVINWDGRTPSGILVRPGVYYYIITSSETLYNRNGFIHIFH